MNTENEQKKQKRKNAWKNLPDVCALIKPPRGLLEFVGGLMTAIFALVYLIHTSVMMTALAFGILLVFGGFINKAFKTIRPIFRARPKINAEVTGRLTESLGGVRVVKGYHAEEREEKVFSAGVQRLLDNVLKTLTATSLMS